MSTFNYTLSVATARRLIKKFGKGVVLVKKTKTGSPSSPVYVPIETPLIAVDLEKTARDKAGTLTSKTERRLLIEGSAAAVPEKADVIKIGGVENEIKAVKTLNPGDTVVLYTVWLVT